MCLLVHMVETTLVMEKVACAIGPTISKEELESSVHWSINSDSRLNNAPAFRAALAYQVPPNKVLVPGANNGRWL